MSLRVSELQVLLGYAGRNKHGRKHELLTMALHLLKAGCSPAVQMKIKELYCRRFPTKMGSPSELVLPGPHYPASGGVAGGGGTAALPAGLSSWRMRAMGMGEYPRRPPCCPSHYWGLASTSSADWRTTCPPRPPCIRCTQTSSCRGCPSTICWTSSSSPPV